MRIEKIPYNTVLAYFNISQICYPSNPKMNIIHVSRGGLANSLRSLRGLVMASLVSGARLCSIRYCSILTISPMEFILQSY